MSKIKGKVKPHLKARINNIQLHIDQTIEKYGVEKSKEVLLALIERKMMLVEMV